MKDSEEKIESTDSNVDEATSQETDTETTETSTETEGTETQTEEIKTEGEGGDQGEDGQPAKEAKPEVDLDNLDEESIFFIEPTKDGERKRTLREFKTLQGENTRLVQRLKEAEQGQQSERDNYLREIDRFKVQYPAEYAKLEGFLKRDPEILKELPTDLQVQIRMEQEKEREKSEQAQKDQEDAIKAKMDEINNQLDTMAKDGDNYPDFDEQKVLNYARDHMIPNVEDAYRAWHYEKVRKLNDDQIAEIEKATILKYEQDKQENKVPPTPPPGGKGRVKEDEFKNLSPNERLRKRAEQLAVSEGMRK